MYLDESKDQATVAACRFEADVKLVRRVRKDLRAARSLMVNYGIKIDTAPIVKEHEAAVTYLLTTSIKDALAFLTPMQVALMLGVR